MKLSKDRIGYYYELLDRLSCIADNFENNIVNHDSDDILSYDEKMKVCMAIADAYQLVGQRICEVEE